MTLTVGRRGAVVIPAPMRRRLGIDHGSLVLAEEANGTVTLRPAVAVASDDPVLRALLSAPFDDEPTTPAERAAAAAGRAAIARGDVVTDADLDRELAR